MRAMILAAGRGERMRPLSDRIPKPLLSVAGRPLIEYHLIRLADAGYKDIVINLAWLGEKIRQSLGDGSRFGVRIHYSPEPPGGLETAGGIRRALSLLGDAPFLAISADIWCDHPLAPHDLGDDLGHLVLVDNPPHHPQGDFSLDGDRVSLYGDRRLTYSGIGFFSPELFAGLQEKSGPLAPVLRRAMRKGRVRGEYHRGEWMDVGTPERLRRLRSRFISSISKG